MFKVNILYFSFNLEKVSFSPRQRWVGGTCESDDLGDGSLTVGGDTPVLAHTAPVYVEDGQTVPAGPLVDQDVVCPPVYDGVVPVPGEGGAGHPRHPADQLLLLPRGGVYGPLPHSQTGTVLDLEDDRPPDWAGGEAILSGAGEAPGTVPGDQAQAQHGRPVLCHLAAVQLGPAAAGWTLGTAPLQPGARRPCKHHTLTLSLSLSVRTFQPYIFSAITGFQYIKLMYDFTLWCPVSGEW